MRRTFTMIALLLILAACEGGGDDNNGDPFASNSIIQWDRSPQTVVFRTEVAGGDDADSFLIKNEIPLCSIYGDNRVVWTKLIVNFANCRLMTDGVLRTAVENVRVRALALDPYGALFYAGGDLDSSADEIFEVPEAVIAAGTNDANTHRRIVSSDDSNMGQPTTMATDGFYLYWTNHVITDADPQETTIARAGVSAFNQEVTFIFPFIVFFHRALCMP